jgi:hypothetical protein
LRQLLQASAKSIAVDAKIVPHIGPFRHS